jgi:hypothetical protein
MGGSFAGCIEIPDRMELPSPRSLDPEDIVQVQAMIHCLNRQEPTLDMTLFQLRLTRYQRTQLHLERDIQDLAGQLKMLASIGGHHLPSCPR